MRIQHEKCAAGKWASIALCALSLLPAACSAQSPCPWLNNATATGVLGGPVTVEAKSTPAGAGICVFQYKDKVESNTLRIAVIKASKPEDAGKEMAPYESKCTAAGLSLKGVGNEALICVSNVHKSNGELVVGRVRDQIFTVSISDGSGNDPAFTQEALEDKAQEIARMVAGILF